MAITVLAIDDSRTMRSMVRRALDAAGIEASIRQRFATSA